MLGPTIFFYGQHSLEESGVRSQAGGVRSSQAGLERCGWSAVDDSDGFVLIDDPGDVQDKVSWRAHSGFVHSLTGPRQVRPAQRACHKAAHQRTVDVQRFRSCLKAGNKDTTR